VPLSCPAPAIEPRLCLRTADALGIAFRCCSVPCCPVASGLPGIYLVDAGLQVS